MMQRFKSMIEKVRDFFDHYLNPEPYDSPYLRQLKEMIRNRPPPPPPATFAKKFADSYDEVMRTLARHTGGPYYKKTPD